MAESGFANSDANDDTNLISKRAEVVQDWKDFLIKYCILCISDPFDPESSPNGYINFGTAVNDMCNDILYPKITSSEVWNCDTTLLNYYEPYGIPRLRKAFAAFMTEMLHPYEAVDPKNLFCITGVTSAIDLLAHCLCDPGDYILCPTPVYCRIYTDMLQRSEVKLLPSCIYSIDNVDTEPMLLFEALKDDYYKAKQHGKNIRGVLLLNPNNPLGNIYSPELILDILNFCNEEKLHVIMDEVYALSVYGENSNFKSILSFPSVPDPERTHMLYGLSKDFAVAGLRIGVIHTKCQVLQRCLAQLTMFQVIPFPVMAIASRLLEDLDWCKKFVDTNKRRLLETYTFFRHRIEKMGLKARHGEAAFFLWVDFGHKCTLSTFEDEQAFFDYLIDKFHLYIVPGKELFCEQPGYFRITFTGNPAHLETGLERLEQAVNQYPSYSRRLKENGGNKESLEDLVDLLKNQIKDSNWLTENTSEKWVVENPQLGKLFVKKKTEM